MPVFYQQDIDANTRLGIWVIEEEEIFFQKQVHLQREVTHPHKRLQHLAGRFLLKFLFPDFPADLIQIADTRKPFLPNEEYHFSISHCGNFAAAIVSSKSRVGIDIEIPTEKVIRISHKFRSDEEQVVLAPSTLEDFTFIWSAKEAVYKWYGDGCVDFKEHIRLRKISKEKTTFQCHFAKTDEEFEIHLKQFPGLCLSFVKTEITI